MTRLQANMIRETDMEKRRIKKGKRGRKPGQSSKPKKENNVVSKKVQQAASESTRKQIRKCFQAPLPERSRRSSVNYARIREGWFTTNESDVANTKVVKSESEIKEEPMDTSLSVAVPVAKPVEDKVSIEEEPVKLSNQSPQTVMTTIPEEPEEPPAKIIVVKDKIEVEDINEKKSKGRGRPPKRRTTFNGFSDAMSRNKRPRLSLDSKVGLETATLIQTEKSDKSSIPVTPPNSSNIGIETAETLTRKKTPGRPRKDGQIKPSERKSEDESEESDCSSGSAGLVPSKRICTQRRSSSSSLHNDKSSRVVFPLEVKADAIKRVKAGVTQVEVAKDLQCPLSTVASWWQKRNYYLSLHTRKNKKNSPTVSRYSKLMYYMKHILKAFYKQSVPFLTR